MVESLPFIRAVVNPCLRRKITVTVFRPRLPPFLRPAMFVPVVCRDRDALPEIFRPLALTHPCLLPAVPVKDRDAVLRRVLLVLCVIRGECRIKDRSALSVPRICKDRSLFGLPLGISVNAPNCEHDMRVGISVPFVMERPVRYHALCGKVLLDICPHAFYLLRPCHFRGQRNLNLSCKLCVRPLFNLLYFIPQGLPVVITCRCIVRQENF